jgi:sugar/nucleoside kinase (ribokinase family)
MHADTKSYDMIIFGNYTKDTIVSSAGTRFVDGGGFNYGAHAAVALGLKVAAVTQLAKEDLHVVRALERLGIDVYPRTSSTSTHMRLEYPSSNVDDRVLYCTKSAGPYSLDQFKDLQAKAVMINGSIRDEVPVEVVEGLRANFALLAADVQGFVRIIAPDRRLVYGEWKEKEHVLSQLDVLKADIVEAEFLTGESDVQTAARTLAEMGPREVVITHHEGILVYAGGTVHQASFHVKNLVGRSGRGDTCIASYMAKRLTVPPSEAILWSAALTSLKMEAEGPFRGKVSDVQELVDQKYRS